MLFALRLALAVLAAVTFAASLWSLSQSPFAQPFRDRTDAELRVAVARVLERNLTPTRLSDGIDAALDGGRFEEAVALARLAEARAIPVQDDTAYRLAKAEAAREGLGVCLACAWNPDDCPDMTRVALCNLPGEMTPLGDLNALRRGLTDWMSGDPVDRVDVALAAVGLAASAAVLVTVGTSASIKSGATALRVARRVDALTPPLSDELSVLAMRSLDFDRVKDVLRFRAPVAALLTPSGERLAGVAADVGRIGARTDAGNTLALLRHADTTGELARVARVTDVAGRGTPGMFALLGKARLLRLTHRLTDAALAALALLGALAAQIFAWIVWFLRHQLAGLDRRRRHAHARPKRGMRDAHDG